MTDRKTLQLRDPADTAEAPALKKKGRGWEISDKRLIVALHLSALAGLAGCSPEAEESAQAEQGESRPSAAASPLQIDVDAALTPETRAGLAELMGDVDEEVQAYADSVGRFPDQSAQVESLAGVDGAGLEMIFFDLQAAYPDEDAERLEDAASRYMVEKIEQKFEELKVAHQKSLAQAETSQ